ncbi:50S ribosomal protein L10 [Sulfurivirga sp.]|uniref:50S ribosomal protein L10 n=1 Tax=Sulfurivirga sp. TaxID=2614236 RepID=UPI002600F15F|nr:50S ribosomal protein L10 [Sulfurivirga sp.]
MALKLEDKKRIVEEVHALVESAYSVVAAEYRGLTVEQMTQLRRQAREAGVVVRVVKNTLARRALQDTQFEDMGEHLVGPLVLLISTEDPGSAARIVKNFRKEVKELEPKVLSIGKGAMPGEQLDAVASLPTYEEAISKLLYVMKAPVEKFARTLNEVPGKLVRTVAAIKDAKEAA